MLDAMLVRAHADSNCRSVLEFSKACLAKNQENNQTFGLLAEMTEDVWYSINQDSHGCIALSTEDFSGSRGCSDFLISNIDT